MTWTQFWDMHSGGGTKEEPYEKIYIEAPEKEAIAVFYNRFGHDPLRISCTCCGEDYSITESDDLHQATGYERNCYYRPVGDGSKDEHGQEICHYYDEDDPEEAARAKEWGSEPRAFTPLDEYLERKDILLIRADEITDESRTAEIPDSGWQWVG